MRSTSTLIHGLADVRISAAAPYLTTYADALTTSNSVGFVGSVQVTKETTDIVRHDCKGVGANSRVYPTVIGYSSDVTNIKIDISSFTPSNLSIILGDTDGIDTDPAVIESAMSLLLTKIGAFRIEVVSAYNLRQNCLKFIIPSASLSSSLDLTFSSGSFANSPLAFTSNPVLNTVWKDSPTGRLIIK